MADFNNMNDNIKIYNLEPYVLIDGVSGTYNIAQGQGALCANTIGNFNIGSGLGALNCNETGVYVQHVQYNLQVVQMEVFQIIVYIIQQLQVN